MTNRREAFSIIQENMTAARAGGRVLYRPDFEAVIMTVARKGRPKPLPLGLGCGLGFSGTNASRFAARMRSPARKNPRPGYGLAAVA